MRRQRLDRNYAREQSQRVTRVLENPQLDPLVERIVKAFLDGGGTLTEPDRDLLTGILTRELYEARRRRKLGISLEHGPSVKETS